MQNTALIEKIRNLPPETVSEVENFVDFLTDKKRVLTEQKRREQLLAFVNEYAGTSVDLDEDLESAGVEHLLETYE